MAEREREREREREGGGVPTLIRSLERARTSVDMSIVGEFENFCFMYSNTPASNYVHVA